MRDWGSAMARGERASIRRVAADPRSPILWLLMRILRRAEDVPRRSLWQRIKDVALMDVGVLARGGVAPGSLERLEEILLEADFGVPTTVRLVEEVERRAQRGEVKTQDEF